MKRRHDAHGDGTPNDLVFIKVIVDMIQLMKKMIQLFFE